LVVAGFLILAALGRLDPAFAVIPIGTISAACVESYRLRERRRDVAVERARTAALRSPQAPPPIDRY